MQQRALLAILATCSLLYSHCAAQPVLVASSVSGKLGYKPGTNFCEATVHPASSTAYLSGQTGGSNATTIQGQTQAAMNGLNATITALGSSLDAVLKTTIFMTNISDFSAMNPVYTSYFKPNSTLPARSTVQIDMIAADPIFATMKASSA